MNKALLDTDIYSEALKAVDQNVARNAAAYRQANGFLTISVITIMEVIQGLQRVGGSNRIQVFRNAIAPRKSFPSSKTPLIWRDRSQAIWIASGGPSAVAIR